MIARNSLESKVTGGAERWRCTTIHWLIMGQVLLLLPHVLRAPNWLWLYCALLMGWTLSKAQSDRYAMPSAAKLGVVAIGVIFLWLSFSQWFTVMFWVGLLALMLVAKLIELRSDRDAYQILLLGFFFALTHFLYSESILQTVYTLACLWVLCATLMLLQSPPGSLKGLEPLWRSSSTLLLAIPLLIVLFVFFPRMSPFWTIPLDKNVGVTGLSDRLVLGDIDRLVRSDELVFRATFLGEPPPSRSLYWRTLVLNELAGSDWRWNPESRVDFVPAVSSSTLSYTLVTQPLSIAFVPSLARVQRVFGEGVRVSPLGVVKSHQTLSSVAQYQMQSELEPAFDESLTQPSRIQHLSLSTSANPITRAYGLALKQQWPKPRDRVAQVLNWFEREFTYTLSPGTVSGEDSIDTFLFDTKRGFCEHFAASFSVLMRAAGIPARVVLGYQGGQYNPVGNYIEVRQFDAHAWSEIWIEGVGWRRVDPTSVIAPERIEKGMTGMIRLSGQTLTDATWRYLQLQGFAGFYQLQQRLQALGHLWDRTIVNYDQSEQWTLLQRHWPKLDTKHLGLIGLVCFLLCFGMLGLSVLLNRRGGERVSHAHRWHRDFAQCASLDPSNPKVRAKGVVEIQEVWSKRSPEEAELATNFVHEFVSHQYQGGSGVLTVTRALWQLKATLLWWRWVRPGKRWRSLSRA